MRIRRLSAVLLALLAVTTNSARTRAEIVNCTPITTLPAVISTPGVYCLTGSLATNIASGHAIDIQSSNVILDLNGFRLAGSASAATQAFGIHAQNRQYVTIRNGTVRGFLGGIFLEGSGGWGHLVEDVRSDQNKLVGIGLMGHFNTVRNNQVFITGGGTDAPFAVGIILDGNGNRAINNDVMHVFHPAQEAAGISFEGVGNVDNLAVGNRISSAPSGLVIEGAGKYRDNLTSGVTVPYTGGTNVGNNQ